MESQSSERHPIFGRLNTAYWLFLVILLGLPLITPLLNWSAVACTHDGHLHYHRVAAMAHAWENGIYLSRWLPDVAFGYGYPFFVYREAAPLYAVLLPHLAGLPLPAASNLFYAATILLCGIFMFLWVRDLFGPRAALVSAVAYMAAPYVLIDALVRGNAPESMALPLLPFLFWAGRRWVLFASPWAFLGGVLGLGLLSLSHNISTMILAPTLLVYLLALALWSGRRATSLDRDRNNDAGERQATLRHRLLRLAALLILGLGLAFFYTGGALLEMNQVTLELSTTTRNNDWRFNFASLAEIFAPVAAEDPALINPPLRIRLGWIPVLLAAGGLSGLLWIRNDDTRAREQRLHICLMAVATGLFLFMAMPVSRRLWEALPLIDFVQFPWRFVGRAALPVAFLAGVPFYWFEYRNRKVNQRQPVADGRSAATRWWPLAALLVAVSLLVLEAIPNLYPRYCPEEPYPTIQTVHQYEHATGLVGVDPEGSYFPRTVRERPAGSPLEDDYAAGRTPMRFDTSALPIAARIEDIQYQGHGVRLTLDSPEPFTARYLSFAFPGWSARIDGQPVAITPEEPSGLISFEIPAGRHEISMAWGTTPLRTGLVAISLMSAASAAAIMIRAMQRRPNVYSRRQPADSGSPAGVRRNEWLALALLAIALLGIKFVVDGVDTPLRRAGGPPVATAATFQAGDLRFDGFTLSRNQVPAGQTFDIDMAWTAISPPALDYQSEVSLVGPDGLTWSRKGTERPRLFEDAAPSRQWTTGEWAWDSREVQTLSGTPPGLYDVVVTLFDRATLAPVTLANAQTGERVGPSATIGMIEVTNPDEPPEFFPQYEAGHDFPQIGLRLLGFNQDRSEATPGEPVLQTLFWQCLDRTLCERFTLRLQDESGQEMATWRLPAVRDGFSPDSWPEHGRLRGQHIIQLPADLASGRYRFMLEDYPLGEVAVTAPDRAYVSPALAAELNQTFSTPDGKAVAELMGFAAGSTATPCPVRASGATCSVPLVWRAGTPSPISYRVFVHLLDGSGNIVTQSDSEPASRTRPTTGWLTGEYIVDTHNLTLPENLAEGPFTLSIGLYDPVTGKRLLTGAGDSAIVPLP